MNGLRKFLGRNANNFRGWRTKRKIVVIESDDWGSICMPSKAVYKSLLRKGYRVDRCPYATNDSFASEEDLGLLFSLLRDYRDSNGSHPVITANTVLTNPDFKKIKKSGFKRYSYEPFTKTLERYPGHKNVFKVWKKGVDEGLFFPQFHGREHLNIDEWMGQIRNKDTVYRNVFKERVCWLGPDYNTGSGVSMRAAYDTNDFSDLEKQKLSLNEGLLLFNEIFGFNSKSFIAPNYKYHPDLNKTLSDGGVEIIQGMKYQKLPRLGKPNLEMIRHYQGEKNDLGHIYLVRNCVFEPSQFSESHDNVGECLKGIKNAFFWRKPAIVSAHRLNFIGYINPENRERNLPQFRELLHRILKQWPDVEFMTSVELGMLMGSK
jgi:hypothetical protein